MIIDTDNYGALGIETMFFPGGEPHAKLPSFRGDVLFYGKLRNWNDVGMAALVLDALRRQKVNLKVFIPYFPGARQDRSDGHAPLTLQVMASLFSGPEGLYVFDIHSDVTRQKTRAINLGWENLSPPGDRYGIAGVISPDAGARLRAKAYRDLFHPLAKLVHGNKVRNPQSGALSNYTVERLPAPGHYVIVDDICDGGGTFNLLMEAALADPLADECTFELVVSHGIFSKGLENLHPRIEYIVTTDSWCRLKSDKRLTVVSLFGLARSLDA